MGANSPVRPRSAARTLASSVCNCKRHDAAILVLHRRGRGSSVPAAFTATRARKVRFVGSVLSGDRFFEGPFVPNSSGQAQSLAHDHDEAGEGAQCQSGRVLSTSLNRPNKSPHGNVVLVSRGGSVPMRDYSRGFSWLWPVLLSDRVAVVHRPMYPSGVRESLCRSWDLRSVVRRHRRHLPPALCLQHRRHLDRTGWRSYGRGCRSL